MRVQLLAAVIAGAAVLSSTASAVTLDFSSAICGGGTSCGNGEQIDASYGDSAQIDVGYRSLVSGGDGAVHQDHLKWWNDYGDLPGVAWGGSNASYVSEISLDPADGFEVQLVGFDLGSYQNAARSGQVTIYDLDYNVLYSSGPFTTPTGETHLDFDLNLAFNDGLRIQWGPDGYDIGLDNLVFNVRAAQDPQPTPAPAALGLFALGLLGLAGLRRRT